MKKTAVTLFSLFGSLSFVIISCKKELKTDLRRLSKPAIETIVRDTGLYSGFPWPATLSNGTIVTVWKESYTHADAGAMMFGKSSDGGATWRIKQIEIQAIPIQCS